MSKIEQQMNDAITNNENWQSANTAVIYDPETNESKVYLHGNHIATVGDDFVQIFDGGEKSKTTKSRLNAILKEHAIDGECVFQRNFKWFVHKFIGQCGTSPVYNEYDFTDGFMFAWYFWPGDVIKPTNIHTLFVIFGHELRNLQQHRNREHCSRR